MRLYLLLVVVILVALLLPDDTEALAKGEKKDKGKVMVKVKNTCVIKSKGVCRLRACKGGEHKVGGKCPNGKRSCCAKIQTSKCTTAKGKCLPTGQCRRKHGKFVPNAIKAAKICNGGFACCKVPLITKPIITTSTTVCPCSSCPFLTVSRPNIISYYIPTQQCPSCMSKEIVCNIRLTESNPSATINLLDARNNVVAPIIGTNYAATASLTCDGTGRYTYGGSAVTSLQCVAPVTCLTTTNIQLMDRYRCTDPLFPPFGIFYYYTVSQSAIFMNAGCVQDSVTPLGLSYSMRAAYASLCPNLIQMIRFEDTMACRTTWCNNIMAFGAAQINMYRSNPARYKEMEDLGYCSPSQCYCGATTPLYLVFCNPATNPPPAVSYFYTSSYTTAINSVNTNPTMCTMMPIQCYLWQAGATTNCASSTSSFDLSGMIDYADTNNVILEGQLRVEDSSMLPPQTYQGPIYLTGRIQDQGPNKGKIDLTGSSNLTNEDPPFNTLYEYIELHGKVDPYPLPAFKCTSEEPTTIGAVTNAVSPSRSEATEGGSESTPPGGEATTPSGGEATTPSGGEATTPSEAETTTPSEGEATTESQAQESSTTSAVDE